MRMHDTETGTVDEDWDVLLSFLPRDWRELARDTGALKGLRKDKTVDNLLRTLLLHLGCGHYVAGNGGSRPPSASGGPVRRGAVEAAEEIQGLAARAVCASVRGAGSGGHPRRRVPGPGGGCDDGEGTGTERVVVAAALQRGPAVAHV